MWGHRNTRPSWTRQAVSAAVVSGLCASGPGTGGAAHAQNAPPESFERAVPVIVSIATDKKTYAAGDPIKITLTVKNNTKLAESLRFSSGQRYDFKLYDAKTGTAAKPDESKLVWQWSRGHMFAMMIGSEKLDPGKTLVFSDKYEFKSAPGQTAKPLAAGKYTLVGILTTMGGAPRPTAATPIEIK